MSLYGPNTGYVPFTGFTNTLRSDRADLWGTTGKVQMNGMTQQDAHINRMLRTKGNRAMRELLLTILGASSGSTAAETTKRVTAEQAFSSASQGGGVRPIETQTYVNRATTAADVTNFTALFSRIPYPSTYAVDASGNGAGHKAGW